MPMTRLTLCLCLVLALHYVCVSSTPAGNPVASRPAKLSSTKRDVYIILTDKPRAGRSSGTAPLSGAHGPQAKQYIIKPQRSSKEESQQQHSRGSHSEAEDMEPSSDSDNAKYKQQEEPYEHADVHTEDTGYEQSDYSDSHYKKASRDEYRSDKEEAAPPASKRHTTYEQDDDRSDDESYEGSGHSNYKSVAHKGSDRKYSHDSDDEGPYKKEEEEEHHSSSYKHDKADYDSDEAAGGHHDEEQHQDDEAEYDKRDAHDKAEYDTRDAHDEAEYDTKGAGRKHRDSDDRDSEQGDTDSKHGDYGDDSDSSRSYEGSGYGSNGESSEEESHHYQEQRHKYEDDGHQDGYHQKEFETKGSDRGSYGSSRGPKHQDRYDMEEEEEGPEEHRVREEDDYTDHFDPHRGRDHDRPGSHGSYGSYGGHDSGDSYETDQSAYDDAGDDGDNYGYPSQKEAMYSEEPEHHTSCLQIIRATEAANGAITYALRCCAEVDNPKVCLNGAPLYPGTGTPYPSYPGSQQTHGWSMFDLITSGANSVGSCTFTPTTEPCPKYTQGMCQTYVGNCTLSPKAADCGCPVEYGLNLALRAYARNVAGLSCQSSYEVELVQPRMPRSMRRGQRQATTNTTADSAPFLGVGTVIQAAGEDVFEGVAASMTMVTRFGVPLPSGPRWVGRKLMWLPGANSLSSLMEAHRNNPAAPAPANTPAATKAPAVTEAPQAAAKTSVPFSIPGGLTRQAAATKAPQAAAKTPVAFGIPGGFTKPPIALSAPAPDAQAGVKITPESMMAVEPQRYRGHSTTVRTRQLPTDFGPAPSAPLPLPDLPFLLGGQIIINWRTLP